MPRLIDADALQLEPDPWGGMNGVLILGRSGGKTISLVRAALKQMIENAPTVDAVEVVHGRWIHPKGYVVSNGFICSECGHEESSLYPINPRPGGACIADEHGNFYHPPKMNYCPHCGAKMDGDGNG